MALKNSIVEIKHPHYDLRIRDWQKWRLTYYGGQQFIDQYLKQYSKRETYPEFVMRKAMTYCPSFAKASVDEVKNSIYQRMADISRDGGSDAYRDACAGLKNGVDLLGNTMTSFIGQHVLPELLTMGKVGVYVDMPPLSGNTLRELGNKRPYIYMYETEDIQSWTYDESDQPNEFSSLLLKDYIYTYDSKTGLASGQTTRLRHYWLTEDPDTGLATVMVQFYNNAGDETDIQGTKGSDSAINLSIPRIPFVVLELSDSLLSDIANYQIALLNLESSDLSFLLKANFPFYTEQNEPRATSPHLRPAGQDAPGSAATATTGAAEEVNVGASHGRRYPIGADRPGFIHPSPEPLLASMKKEEQIKSDIRLLLNLSISNLQARATSAEAKGFDERSLEAGLSAIGLELEAAERSIATHWATYEGKPPSTIKYPEKYNLKSDEERRKEATDTVKLVPAVSSKTYQREMMKQAVRRLLGNRISEDKLRKIEKEIDDSLTPYADPEIIKGAVEGGYLDMESAAIISGFPKDAPKKAADEHAARLARIAANQAPAVGNAEGNNAAARGVPDADTGVGSSGSKEKTASRDQTGKDSPADATRGKGKGTSKE